MSDSPPLDDAGRRPPARPVKFTHRPAVQRAIAAAVHMAGGLMRWLGPERAGTFASAVARTLAPLARENRLALENLRRAFPERSEPELIAIRRGAWDNLARTIAEMPSIRDLALKDRDNPSAGLTDRIELSGAEWITQLRDDGRPGIAFLGHLGNWEVLMPFIASFGARPMVLYRAPRNRRVLEDLQRWRGDFCELIESRPGAAARVAAGMKEGGHLCMLIDQRLPGAPSVPFFGRPAETNPIVARLARQFDCPVVGARCIRLPGSRFRVEVTPPLDLPRDPDGKIDADLATAAITGVLEGWVREHPDQWLWLHNRWGD